MMDEILKPLLESELLNDSTKTHIQEKFTEYVTSLETKIRGEIEDQAKQSIVEAQAKLDTTFKTLEEGYQAQLNELAESIESKNETISAVTSELEELKQSPYVGLTDEDLENAEKTIRESVMDEMEEAFEIAKDKFQHTMEIVAEANAQLIEAIEEESAWKDEANASLTEQVEKLQALLDIEKAKKDPQDLVTIAESKVAAEYEAKMKEHNDSLVESVEIFLQQELNELKEEYADFMKEKQGRQFMNTLKEAVKQHWDIDQEIASDLIAIKESMSNKVDAYKDLLSKEHNRVETLEEQVSLLRKQVIIEQKGSVLSDDKKEAMTKIAESMGAEAFAKNADSIMESVLSEFHNTLDTKRDLILEGFATTVQETSETSVSTGDVVTTTTDESLSESIQEFRKLAGIVK